MLIFRTALCVLAISVLGGNQDLLAQNITTLQNMNFAGIAITPGQPATVRLATNNRTSLISGTATLSGGPRSGQFRITGNPQTPVSVNLPEEVVLTLSGTNLRVNRFIMSRPNPIVLDASGLATFNMGADMLIPPNPAVGIYSGTQFITVNY